MIETKQDQNKPYQHYQKDNYPNTGKKQTDEALKPYREAKK